MASYSWPSQGGGGVTIYANLAAFPDADTVQDGTLGVAADTDTLYMSNGVTWNAIGSTGAVLSIGTFDSGTASANGAHIDSNALIMQSASATVPGLVNVSTQTFTGNKTFNGSITASNLSGTNTGDVTLAAVGATPNANAASLTGQALNLQPANASFPGVMTTATQSLAGAKTFTTSISSPLHFFTGSSSGTLTIQAAATTTDHALTMPSAQGSAYTFLMNNGSGALSWTATFDDPQDIRNYTIVTSVAGNALTIAVKTKAGTDPSAADPILVPFRSATANLGTYSTVAITGALSIVVPSGATLGRITNNNDWPLCVWLINNAGTAELAVSTSPAFASIVSTTTIGAGSTSATTMYSTTGRSSVAMTSIGVLTANLPAQNNYTVVPTEIVLTNGSYDTADTRGASPLSYKSSVLGAINGSTGLTIGPNSINMSTGILIGANASSSTTANNIMIGNSISVPLGGAGSNVIVGNSSSTSGSPSRSVVVGTSVTSTAGSDAVAVGQASSAKSDRVVTIGASSGYTTATGADGSVSIGAGASTGAFANSVLITPGPSATNTVDISAANQLAFGSQRASGSITDVRFGAGGVSNTNAVNVSLGITGITGADAAGKNLTIQAGNGTGSGGSGIIVFQTATPAASSSTPNTLATRGGFNAGGGFFLNGTTSGSLILAAAAVTTNHTLTFPSAQGAASSVLFNNGSGTLSWYDTAATNTVDSIVRRDGSGNFAAGTITATLTGTASGNTTIASQTNHGVVIASSTNAMTSTTAGTAGQFLVSAGASADPVWADVGATQSSTFSTAAWPFAADVIGDLASISCTAGTWVISVFLVPGATGGAVTTASLTTGISTTSGNSASGLVAGNTAAVMTPATFASSGDKESMAIPSYIVTPGSTTTYYFKGLAEGSVTNLVAGGRISAFRIK